MFPVAKVVRQCSLTVVGIAVMRIREASVEPFEYRFCDVNSKFMKRTTHSAILLSIYRSEESWCKKDRWQRI